VRERRSRDRYGRDRRGRAPREAAAFDNTPNGDAEAPDAAPFEAQPEANQETPTRSYFSMPTPPEATPALVVTAPVVTAPADPAVAPEPEKATTALPTPAMSPPVNRPRADAAPVRQGLPKVQPYTVSLDELNRVAQASGLEWVNSNADKVAQVQAAIAAEPQPIRMPREIKPVVQVDDGPLVLVETRKDLRKMPLPFETP
jgi:ribonuclease E